MIEKNLWLATKQAAKHLGISERTLRQWRSSEHFKAGSHYRRKGPHPHSEMIYNIYACERAITDYTHLTFDACRSNSLP